MARVEPHLSQGSSKAFISLLVHYAGKRCFHQSKTLRQRKPLRLRPARKVLAQRAEQRKVELLRKRYRLRGDPLAAVAVANRYEGMTHSGAAMSDTRWMRQGFGKH